MNNQVDLVIEMLENEGMIWKDVSNSRNEFGRERIDTTVQGLKVEYHIQGVCFRVGYQAGQENIDAIYEALLDNYQEDEVLRKNNWVDVLKIEAEEFESFLDILQDIDLVTEPEKEFLSVSKKETKKGVSFEGTLLENTKERGASIQAATSFMVCEASGMNPKMLFAEQHFDCGQIDGVEYNQDKTVKSIYEVQSGIFYGDYLDDNHRDKSLGRYLYDPKVIPTVERVVIWAGGYYDSDLLYIKERALELSRRDNPIEVVLLKTIKTNDVYGIGVERVKY
jgi:hypothetical protein